MSAIPFRQLPVTPTEPVFPLTVEQYHSMIQTGVLTDDDPVELLEGVLVFKTPKNPPRSFVVDAVAELVRSRLKAGWSFRQQEPITLSDGEPEPDGAIVRGNRNDYVSRHPTPEDVALVIEVADATLARDRGVKLRSYARGGVAVYWIVNLSARCVETYTRPDTTKAEPQYLTTNVRKESESVELIVSGEHIGGIAVADFFPART